MVLIKVAKQFFRLQMCTQTDRIHINEIRISHKPAPMRTLANTLLSLQPCAGGVSGVLGVRGERGDVVSPVSS